MKAFQNWAEGKPDLIAATALNLLSSANDLHSLLSLMLGDSLALNLDSQHKFSEWLSFYKHRHLYLNFVFSLTGQPSYQNFILSDKQEGLSIINNALRFVDDDGEENPCPAGIDLKTIDYHLVNTAETKKLKELAINEFKNAIEARKDDPDISDWIHNVSSPELIFLLKVAIPAWLCYRKPVTFLFREAQLGNLDSLNKLLRLDSSAIFDKRIAEFMHRLRFTDPAQYAELLKATQRKPKIQVTRQKVKICLAGYLIYLSAILGYRLSFAQTRKLFNAIAFDYGMSSVDSDLPSDPETFKKAVKRELPIWLHLLKNPR